MQLGLQNRNQSTYFIGWQGQNDVLRGQYVAAGEVRL